MAKKLYVGGLPYAATEQEVEEKFAQHGEVLSVSIMRDKFSGQSRGFGFVEMADDGQAQQAIDTLNGTDFNGRQLTVNEARPQEKRFPGGGGGFGGGGRDRRGGDRGGRGGFGGGRGGKSGGGGRW